MTRDVGQALLIISGPSGVGKTSVARALSDGSERFTLAVTSTTRAARPGELDGRDYHFLTDEEFDRLVSDDGFIERVSARGARYGLTKTELERVWEGGRVPVLVLDPDGKDAVKALYPQALSVFIDAPSAVVTERLLARGDTDVAARIRDNLKVWAARGSYDAVISNGGDIKTCVDGVRRAFGRRPGAGDAVQTTRDPAHGTTRNEGRRNDMAAYDSRIPERLQLLRVGIGGADELGVFMFSITGDYYPSFCLAPATNDPETMDVTGAIEQTLHDLLDYGGTDKDVRSILGLVPREELDDAALEYDEYTEIDLGWCIDGRLLSFEKLDPEASSVRAILTDMQISNIMAWFDTLPAEECLAAAEEVAHNPSYKGAAIKPDPLADLTTGKWRVHLVMPGEHYGRDDVLTYEPEDAVKHGSGLPLVEFYDTSQDPAAFPGGQYVSRYYMDTLLGTDSLKLGVPIRDMSALSLDGGIPAWTVSGDDLKRVADWLDTAYIALGGQPTENGGDTPERAVSLADVAQDSRDAADALSGHEPHDDHETDAR